MFKRELGFPGVEQAIVAALVEVVLVGVVALFAVVALPVAAEVRQAVVAAGIEAGREIQVLHQMLRLGLFTST